MQVQEENTHLSNLVAGLANENLKIKNELEALKKEDLMKEEKVLRKL